MSSPQTIVNATESFTLSKVLSRDGTAIGYKSMGQGRGIILIHGALNDSNDLTKLAQELAHSFTVHIMDRRGRGLSGPQGNEYTMSKECEDVTAIQEATGAAYVFGHSYGGLVSLEYAIKESSISKIAAR